MNPFAVLAVLVFCSLVSIATAGGPFLVTLLLSSLSPELTLSTHHGFAPLRVEAVVRVRHAAEDDYVCLGWKAASEGDTILNVEPEGVDCRPPAARTGYSLVLSEGNYLLRAWTERHGRVSRQSTAHVVRVLSQH